jgi:carbon storage regulator
MLCLTRNVSETLLINDNITVTVLGIQGYQVRLSISAPKEMNIVREELLLRGKKPKDKHAKGALTLENTHLAKNNAVDSAKRQPRVTYKRRNRRLIPDPT